MNILASGEKELHMSRDRGLLHRNYMRKVCAINILRNPMSIGAPDLTVNINNNFNIKKKKPVRLLNSHHL